MYNQQSIKYLCICCEGSKDFGDCPLCEGIGYFEDSMEISDLPCYMVDFYGETTINPHWYNLSDENKEIELDKELKNYFKDIP